MLGSAGVVAEVYCRGDGVVYCAPGEGEGIGGASGDDRDGGEEEGE